MRSSALARPRCGDQRPWAGGRGGDVGRAACGVWPRGRAPSPPPPNRTLERTDAGGGAGGGSLALLLSPLSLPPPRFLLHRRRPSSRAWVGGTGADWSAGRSPSPTREACLATTKDNEASMCAGRSGQPGLRAGPDTGPRRFEFRPAGRPIVRWVGEEKGGEEGRQGERCISQLEACEWTSGRAGVTRS